MAGIYYWFPKISGRMLSEKLGKIQWGLMTAGVCLLMFPMLGLGIEGMRRRVFDYAPGSDLRALHIATAVGGFLVFSAIVILIVNIVRGLKKGAAAGNNPWESRTLEWQTSSPPPEDNFVKIPRVMGNPYGYGVKGSEHSTYDESTAGEGSKNE